MKRWIITVVAIPAAFVVISGAVGCGAKLPTTAEDGQGDQHGQKLQTYTEVIESNGTRTPAD